jgi:hypothetical protein
MSCRVHHASRRPVFGKLQTRVGMSRMLSACKCERKTFVVDDDCPVGCVQRPMRNATDTGLDDGGGHAVGLVVHVP